MSGAASWSFNENDFKQIQAHLLAQDAEIEQILGVLTRPDTR